MPRFPTRRHWLRLMSAVTLLLLTQAHAAYPDFVTIDFDTTPPLPVAPTDFSSARDDLTIAGLGTVEGGTPVSTPSFLASFGPGGGDRNAYGTRSDTGFGYLQ